MGVIETKVFKNADGFAVQLPDDFGTGTDVTFSIERSGDQVTITAKRPFDAVEERRKVVEFVKALRALGPPIVPVEIRDPDIFPDRPGLY